MKALFTLTPVLFLSISAFAGDVNDLYLSETMINFPRATISFSENLAVDPGKKKIVLQNKRIVEVVGESEVIHVDTNRNYCVLRTSNGTFSGKSIEKGDTYGGLFSDFTQYDGQTPDLLNKVMKAYLAISGESRTDIVVPGVDDGNLAGQSLEQRYLSAMNMMIENTLDSPSLATQLEDMSAMRKYNLNPLKEVRKILSSSKNPLALIKLPRTDLKAANSMHKPSNVNLRCYWSTYEPKLSDLNAVLPNSIQVSIQDKDRYE